MSSASNLSPSLLIYCIFSALPQMNSACCGLAFDTFFGAVKFVSLTHRSGNSSKRLAVKTTTSAFFAFVGAPIALSIMMIFSGAAVPVRFTR